ncbi:hypothetical protein RclHR1_08900009 [Rhizophagus clarus]|uniref:Protein kinase domain-containing protein n=2 Tax=Rhizophagus clarus TaxID=94130 RepID=A0A2Z6SD93_9GLOM|nr:hypothetical protein RclHR1_08900009 [Rhizophagus clarus]
MEDVESKKIQQLFVIEKITNGTSSRTNMVQCAGVKVVAETAVSFTKFLPIISEIGNIFNEIVDLVEAAEHNKRTCKILKDRVYAIELIVLDLKVQREDNEVFLNNKNYLYLQNLTNIIVRIRKFISEISQMKTLIKYIKAKNIKKTFIELCEEFDDCVNVLSFSINVKIADELAQLKVDQDDLVKYLQEMVAGIKADVNHIDYDTNEIEDYLENLSNQFSSTVVKVNVMNNTMEKLMNEPSQNQTKIDNIFQVHPLELSDYEKDDSEKPRKNGRVTKWYNVINKDEEVAFKSISEKEDKIIVQNQVTILKELHNWENIIKFYGIISDGNKWYLIVEWAECGNLREFYQNKDNFDLKLKLRISLDIARGLNFLRTVEIFHRDIRSKNILITIDETAKLANFNYLSATTLNQSQNLERVRYCAPELLERAPNSRYDRKCEVYSFGILLWEIAEERIPYEGNNDILDITDKVRNKRYRELFSENSQMPEEFKQLEIKAVRDDPYSRPIITKMFEVLRDCFRDNLKKHSQDLSRPSSSKPFTPRCTPKRAFSINQDKYTLPINLPDFESFSANRATAKNHGQLSNEQKIRAITMLECGLSTREVAKKIGCASNTTILRIKKKYEETGNVENKPRSGRPRKLNERDERILVRRLATEECSNAVQLQKSIKTYNNIEVSANTVRRALKRSRRSSILSEKK